MTIRRVTIALTWILAVAFFFWFSSGGTAWRSRMFLSDHRELFESAKQSARAGYRLRLGSEGIALSGVLLAQHDGLPRTDLDKLRDLVRVTGADELSTINGEVCLSFAQLGGTVQITSSSIPITAPGGSVDLGDDWYHLWFR